ncbi:MULTISPECIES: restriction endonuclease [unclassified Aeromicrobium]|uniref:restriction endonuclease n=1 Tax=unclassified Aeromicrobium TaxID=2633570 RepID=UPI00288C4749|nr:MULTISPECIES: restriction endonuclease [unclassified Aeromicrobium]
MSMGKTRLLNWRAEFRRAEALPSDAGGVHKRARGRQFERILSAAFEEAGLQPRLSYRPRGEEIDGSIWFEGRTILIEAKWTRDPHPASSVYQFRGKVDGKLVGTLGLFISMAGFSEDTVDALVAGKDLNIVLADGEDVRAIVEGPTTFRDALAYKLRAAGDSGTPFAPLNGRQSIPNGADVIFVQSQFDARVLRIGREAFQAHSSGPIVPTAGKLNMVPLMSAVLPTLGGPARVTMVLDDTSLATNLRGDVDDALEALEGESPVVEIVSVGVPLEVAFGLVKPGASRAERRALWALSNAQIKEKLRAVDLSKQIFGFPNLGAILKASGVDVEE